MNDDTQLLRQYAREGSDQAFRELVERHVGLVHATARRLVAGDTHLAQDVTQIVFTDLARKAGSLPADLILGGWLHRHTCFTAAKAVRTEQRRRSRDRIFMEINALEEKSGRATAWENIAPVLDEALNGLNATDRDAIVLRYLQQQDFQCIGRELGLSDDTAQKRVARALDKLRGFLTKRGLTLSTALLATTLDTNAAVPAPFGLAAKVSATALSGAGAATSLSLTSLKSMFTSKIALASLATLAVAGFAAYAWPHQPSTSGALPPAIQSRASVSPAPESAAVRQAGPRVAAPVAAPVTAAVNNVPDATEASVSATETASAYVPSPDYSGTATMVTEGVLVLNPASTEGTLDFSSQSLQTEAEGTTTLTTTENGVSTTRTVNVPASGTFTTSSSNGGATVVISGSSGNPGTFSSGSAVSNGPSGTIMLANPAGTASGVFTTSKFSSKSVKNPDGTITVTTNKDGVITTQTLPAGSTPGSFPTPGGPGQIVTFRSSDQTP